MSSEWQNEVAMYNNMNFKQYRLNGNMKLLYTTTWTSNNIVWMAIGQEKKIDNLAKQVKWKAWKNFLENYGKWKKTTSSTHLFQKTKKATI